MAIFATILCGGSGTRLWPVSRELHPKPFMRMADGESLLQKAFLRAAGLKGVREILAVTNREFFFQTHDEFREVDKGGIPIAYVLEPFGRNTAAAVAVAAWDLRERHGERALMLVLPADHLVRHVAAFGSAVADAAGLAEQGRLVTFGIRPDTPETSYGYIEAEGSQVVRFVEKPPVDVARRFVASGRHLWNSGMFCFTAKAILEEMSVHCPDVLAAVESCARRSERATGMGATQLVLEPGAFGAVPGISVDHAVMERSRKLAVVPCDIGWSDIGSWNAVSELTPADESGNRIEGEAVLHGASDCYVRSSRLVAVVGVEGLAIVDTPDAVLVTSRVRAQEVGQIVSALKRIGHEAHKLPPTVHRPWGTYTVLEEGAGYKIKRIELRPGASLSLQLHHHRSEHWIVVAGVATVVNADREFEVRENESTFIPAGVRHRLSNRGSVPLAIIEVQSGSYLGEDDIVRFGDAYGRITA